MQADSRGISSRAISALLLLIMKYDYHDKHFGTDRVGKRHNQKCLKAADSLGGFICVSCTGLVPTRASLCRQKLRFRQAAKEPMTTTDELTQELRISNFMVEQKLMRILGSVFRGVGSFLLLYGSSFAVIHLNHSQKGRDRLGWDQNGVHFTW